MAPTCESSAPGKVILCGEYSVLQGAPALVLAVDRRVSVSLEAIPGETPGIELCCPGYLSAPCDLQWSRDNQLTNTQNALQLLMTLCNGLLDDAQKQTLQNSRWRLTVDSQALFDQGRKLGLGSSAALCVALNGLFAGVAGSAEFTNGTRAWRALHQLHSLAQGKQGSGVDVAASLAGGVSRFRNHKHQSCELQPFQLPENLVMAFVWTGQSASTAGYLSSLSEWRSHNSDAFERHMQALSDAATNTLIPGSSGASFIASVAEFTRRLHEFAAASGLAVFAQGHQALYDLAARQPKLTYKPCGAGGGDLGIALATDHDSLADFVAKLGKLGVSTIDLNIDPNGLQYSKLANS